MKIPSCKVTITEGLKSSLHRNKERLYNCQTCTNVARQLQEQTHSVTHCRKDPSFQVLRMISV